MVHKDTIAILRGFRLAIFTLYCSKQRSSECYFGCSSVVSSTSQLHSNDCEGLETTIK